MVFLFRVVRFRWGALSGVPPRYSACPARPLYGWARSKYSPNCLDIAVVLWPCNLTTSLNEVARQVMCPDKKARRREPCGVLLSSVRRLLWGREQSCLPCPPLAFPRYPKVFGLNLRDDLGRYVSANAEHHRLRIRKSKGQAGSPRATCSKRRSIPAFSHIRLDKLLRV